MSKYAVGDKVLVEGVIQGIGNNGYDKKYPYSVLVANLQRIQFSEDELRDTTRTYEDGLNDAWELLRIIQGKRSADKMKIFNSDELDKILLYYTYQEALAKIEACVKVGNVVFNAREDVKAVIMDNAIAEGAWQVYTENGCVELWKECEFKKTGKTVDISYLLEQIRKGE